MKSEVFSQKAFNTKGYIVRFENNVTIRLSVNPKIRQHYENALGIAEREVLLPDFIHSKIEETLKKINKALLEKLVDDRDQKILGRTYRDYLAFVQPEDLGTSSEALTLFVESKCGKGSFYEFASIAQRAQHAKSIEILTLDERSILDRIFYTPPPNEVPYHMKQFTIEYAKKLKQVWKENSDEKTSKANAFNLAAWIHMEFVKIHPFKDASGRQARILMNAELKRAVYLPIVFFDDFKYTAAIKEDHSRPGAFADYLHEAYEKSLPLSKMTQFPETV